MTKFVYDQDETISALVSKLIPGMERGFGTCKTIGVVDEKGRFLAGMVFHGWNPDNGTISLSGAALSPKWMSRAAFKRIGDFAFGECGCQMLMMQVPADNERLLGQLATIGFSLIAIPRFYGRDRNGVLATLTEEEWLASRFNVEKEAA